MAYVGSPLVFDIFISYSHGDDGSGNAYLASWSAAFAGDVQVDPRTGAGRRSNVTLRTATHG